MRKLAALTALILMLSCAAPAFAAPPEIMSRAAILVDPRAGNVLFEKNAREQMYPASLTKIMTAILAIEHGNLDHLAVVNRSAVEDLPSGASRLGLTVYEEMPLRDLINAIMLMSGNDAANVIAEHVAGDIPAFVEMMNVRAAQLGAHNTYFTNPTGLHDENHLSTAYDMALISSFAMTIPVFRQSVAYAHLFLDGTNTHPERRYIINTNSMISRMRTPAYYFAPTIGIKTGFTTPAGVCLAAAAGRGRPYELISVTLGAPTGQGRNYSFIDTRALFEFGYNYFQPEDIARLGQILGEVRLRYARGTNRLSLVAEAPLTVLIPRGATPQDVVRRPILPDYVTAPVERGQKIGEMEFLYNGNVIGRTNLTANSSESRHMFWFVFAAADWAWSFLAVRIIVYVVLGIVLLWIILLIVGIRNAVKRSKRRNQRSSNRRY